MEISKLQRLEQEILSLTPEEQLSLLEQIIRGLKGTVSENKNSLDWSALYGLGKGIWEKDAQEYVNCLREDRI